MQRVFLYGTLKKDQPNHARMAAGLQSEDCVFEGIGETQTRYPLIVDPLFNIPFLLGAPNHPKALDQVVYHFLEMPLVMVETHSFAGESNVEGEVYSVSEKMLKNLDELERHPTFYTRQEIPVRLNGRTQVTWCYLLQNFREDFLQRPALRTYDSKDYPEFLGGSHKPPTEEERQKFIAYAKGTA
uniref:Gamma-glutamylcyclotransferase family protein n=1 Tax=Crassostrea virginica TaxID=6565 RepID=A0A8B8AWR8_CRAVI|nr:putative gamma-glutamylcyclotransferase CG2811 isoform X1 [Crassostrea virginica]